MSINCPCFRWYYFLTSIKQNGIPLFTEKRYIYLTLTLMGMSKWVKRALKCLAKSSRHLIMFYSPKIDRYVNFYAKNIRKGKIVWWLKKRIVSIHGTNYTTILSFSFVRTVLKDQFVKCFSCTKESWGDNLSWLEIFSLKINNLQI